MIKKFIKHGNIESVKVQEKVPIISEDPKKQKIYEELLAKYDAVLKRLAKN